MFDSPPNEPRYRADIDGLRAVAVLLVLGFHAFPGRVRGGFIGVDVFFVISGYLISGIIVRGLNASSFSFVEFYARRIRRIVPALLVVLAATLIGGWFLLLADEYALLGKHVAAGAAFLSNIVLWREVGYFDAAAEYKPLLHLWSLGVEEQFYLLWPISLVLLWSARVRLKLAIAAVLAASFVACVLVTMRAPATAFYLPLTRFWELAAGALLVFEIPRSDAASREWTAIAGLALIAIPALLVRRGDGFPGYVAALPVAGTMMLVRDSGRTRWVNARVLSHPLLVGIGLISYPLYLWHWPLLSVLHIMYVGHVSALARIAALGAAFLLALLTYHLVEHPIRTRRTARTVAAPLLTGLLVVGVAGAMTFVRDGLPGRLEQPAPSFVEAGFANSTACEKRYPFARHRYCGLSAPAVAPSVLLLGDSHSRAFFHGLSRLGIDRSYSIVAFGVGGCPPFLGVVRPLGEAGTIDL